MTDIALPNTGALSHSAAELLSNQAWQMVYGSTSSRAFTGVWARSLGHRRRGAARPRSTNWLNVDPPTAGSVRTDGDFEESDLFDVNYNPYGGVGSAQDAFTDGHGLLRRAGGSMTAPNVLVPIAVLPPGTNQYNLVGLSPDTPYTVVLAHQEPPPSTGFTPPAEVNFTSSASVGTCANPDDPIAFVIPQPPTQGGMPVCGFACYNTEPVPGTSRSWCRWRPRRASGRAVTAAGRRWIASRPTRSRGRSRRSRSSRTACGGSSRAKRCARAAIARASRRS